MQEKVLVAEHERGNRLNLDGSRPLPEVLNRNAGGCWQLLGGGARAEDVSAYVERERS